MVSSESPLPMPLAARQGSARSGDVVAGAVGVGDGAGGRVQIDVVRAGVNEAEREVTAQVLEIDIAVGGGGRCEHAGVDFERSGGARADGAAHAGNRQNHVVRSDIGRSRRRW